MAEGVGAEALGEDAMAAAARAAAAFAVHGRLAAGDEPRDDRD